MGSLFVWAAEWSVFIFLIAGFIVMVSWLIYMGVTESARQARYKGRE